MRKIIIAVLIAILAIAILWVFGGKEISVVADQFKMRETESTPVRSVAYEGTGNGGTLIINDEKLTLHSLNPHLGSSKDNQLALAYGGKVFSFGPLRSTESESLSCDIPSDDTALSVRQRSFIPWPTFEGAQPRLNYRNYRVLVWTKSSGAKLGMVWSIDPGDPNSINLIRVEISGIAR